MQKVSRHLVKCSKSMIVTNLNGLIESSVVVKLRADVGLSDTFVMKCKTVGNGQTCMKGSLWGSGNVKW